MKQGTPRTEPGTVFKCKTCNRKFLMLQALRGHCTGHRKPKLPGDGAKRRRLREGASMGGEAGGETVVAAEKASKGGLQEKLTMTVAVPLLWGVPPASETLHIAVRSGGGIVEKVYWQWDFL